jgi:transposase
MNVIPESQPQPQQYPLPVSSAKHPPVCMDLVPSASASASASASETAPPSQDPSVTKEQLKDHLRQWVRVENEISTLSAEIKKRKLIHQQLSASLLRVMKENEIDCFDIANGRIVYSKTKSRAPLNNGQLKSALKTYYKEDTEKANSLAEFLLASRVERTRETIKMKIPKIK